MTSARKIKLRLEARKPRNPIVAPSMQRKAGSHRAGPRRPRDVERRELLQTLKDA